MEQEDKPEESGDWLENIKARGMGDTLITVLDVLEPIGPLGAQVLWLAQPLLGVFGWHKVTGEIANALEEPGGVENLRQRLHNNET